MLFIALRAMIFIVQTGMQPHPSLTSQEVDIVLTMATILGELKFRYFSHL